MTNQQNVFMLMAELNYSVLVYFDGKLVEFNPLIHSKLNYFIIPNEKLFQYLNS
jgi:hypothetical protein